MSIVLVTPDDLQTVVDHGSVISITGTGHDDDIDLVGQRVTFAGDHRAMGGLLALLEEGEEVPALVEDWQIRRVWR